MMPERPVWKKAGSHERAMLLFWAGRGRLSFAGGVIGLDVEWSVR